MELSKKYIYFFFLHFGNLRKISNTFDKQDEPQRLLLYESIDCKDRSYLHAQKAPYQKTYWQSTC